MEAINTMAGQMNLMAFQVGAVPTDGTQQGAGSDCSPFMAILQTILETGDGGTDQLQSANGQGIYAEIKAALGDLFSSPSGAACLSGQKTGQSVTNSLIDIIQQIQQAKGTETVPKALMERLSGLTEVTAGQSTNDELIKEYEGSGSETRDKDGAVGGIEQALLLSLGRLLAQRSHVTNDNGENEQEAERGDKEDVIGQDNPAAEGIMAEIASILLLAEKNGGAVEIPVLPELGRDAVQKSDDLGNAVDEQSGNAMEMSFQAISAQSGDQIMDASWANGSTEPDSGEETAQPADNTDSPQSAANGVAAASAVYAGVVPPLQTSSHAADDSEQPAKTTHSGQEGLTEREAQHFDKTGGDQVVSERTAVRGDGSDGITKAPDDQEVNRLSVDAAEGTFGRAVKDTSVEQNTSAANIQGQNNDLSQHAKILYSRFHEAREGDQQIVTNVQQATEQGSNGLVKKATNEVQSVPGKADELEVVERAPSSKSQSFTNGEGDSQQLGQGLADQRVTERPATNNSGTTSFGDIVAERIARTLEHVVQTNRSDLTLRLKIDGEESVILEMKERAGTVVIGIQCQDKSLVKALENQKEMIVRNLETKNVNTSISITTVGEDDQEGQKQWQRERHGQQRHNWNERQMSSRSYFETLI